MICNKIGDVSIRANAKTLFRVFGSPDTVIITEAVYDRLYSTLYFFQRQLFSHTLKISTNRILLSKSQPPMPMLFRSQTYFILIGHHFFVIHFNYIHAESSVDVRHYYI